MDVEDAEDVEDQNPILSTPLQEMEPLSTPPLSGPSLLMGDED